MVHLRSAWEKAQVIMAEDVNNAFGINFNPTATTTTTVHKTDPSNEELVSATNGEKRGENYKKIMEKWKLVHEATSTYRGHWS